jgi:hypothetical protein
MIGSVTLKSECITAVMVLGPAAKAGIANIAESAIAGKVDAKVERSRHGSRNIDLSWLETGQRPMIHYAGRIDFRRITPWFFCNFETCTKRAMRQSRSRAAVWRWRKRPLSPYK